MDRVNGTFRAHVGEQSYDLELDDRHVTVDGERVEAVLEAVSEHAFSLIIDGKSWPVTIEPAPDGTVYVTIDGRRIDVQVHDERALLMEAYGLAATAAAEEVELRAPMPGLVLRVQVAGGDEVEEGQSLLVLEAMKMENELRAPASGHIKAVHVAEGEAVDKGALLIEFEG